MTQQPSSDPSAAPTVDTVIFDLGGVLAATGRTSDFARRFPDHDPELVTRIIVGDYGQDTDHPWHRLERGEITLAEHRDYARAALAEAGVGAPTMSGGPAILFEPSPPMMTLVHDLRAAGIRLGVLTNNVREFRPLWWDLMPFEELFDDVVDSHEVGLRKPDPRIYQLALARLGSVASRTAFLDDVASNVDAAAAVGLIGVLVDHDPAPAIDTVRRLAAV